MTKDEQEFYLDSWHNKCVLCNEVVDRVDMVLMEAIVPLDSMPEHAAGPVAKYYMVCKECKAKGELI